jgi:hypothetical protein
MKKLLLASALAIASTTAHAQTAIEQKCRDYLQDGEIAETAEQQAAYDRCIRRESAAAARVTVNPALPPGPPPLGWVYKPYTICADPPRCSMGMVNVQADGLNVRVTPNGYPVMSLVNGVPLIPLGQEGDWLLVAAGCDLTPTWAWSWTAGVPLNRCWVYW